MKKEYDINDYKLLTEISSENRINVQTLHSRLKSRNLIEKKDYRSLGERRGILLSPEGIDKILKA